MKVRSAYVKVPGKSRCMIEIMQLGRRKPEFWVLGLGDVESRDVPCRTLDDVARVLGVNLGKVAMWIALAHLEDAGVTEDA